MARRWRRPKKKKKQGSSEEPESVKKAPHSFVIKRGKIGKSCRALMMDFRKILEPYTATNLRVKKRNVIRDYLSVASLLNVSHLLIFTKTDKAAYLRLARLPRGPTLTYKIVNYVLAKDVISSLRKSLVYSGLFQLSPLLVLNNFAGNENNQLKLSVSMWRNLLPSIDVNKVNLNTIRRCILLNYNSDTQLIDLRHYAIKVRPVGVSRAVKKLLTAKKKIPDLGQFNSVEEVMAGDNAFTESEGEGDEHDETKHIVLPQKISSRGNLENEKSAVRLVELGPRLSLELIKVEEGLMTGEVLFHSYIEKTKAEAKALKAQKEQNMRIKLSRKRQQEANVKRKQEKIAKKKKRKWLVQNLEEKQEDREEHMSGS